MLRILSFQCLDVTPVWAQHELSPLDLLVQAVVGGTWYAVGSAMVPWAVGQSQAAHFLVWDAFLYPLDGQGHHFILV